MADINTISLSGVLAGDVEASKAKGMAVTRFFIDVEWAGERSTWGKFKIVAFAEWAEVARKLSEGDRLILVGALLYSGESRAYGILDELQSGNLPLRPELYGHHIDAPRGWQVIIALHVGLGQG